MGNKTPQKPITVRLKLSGGKRSNHKSRLTRNDVYRFALNWMEDNSRARGTNIQNIDFDRGRIVTFTAEGAVITSNLMQEQK